MTTTETIGNTLNNLGYYNDAIIDYSYIKGFARMLLFLYVTYTPDNNRIEVIDSNRAVRIEFDYEGPEDLTNRLSHIEFEIKLSFIG